MTEDFASDLPLDSDERRQVLFLGHLFEAILEAYSSFHVGESSLLPASTSVMYAAQGQEHPGVLNVTLASLVEFNSVSSWQARFLSGAIGARQTVLVAGARGTGKSTLLNTLVQLVPLDHRVVAIEEGTALPALRGRSFTVQLSAAPGSKASLSALKKAAEMQPSWILASELLRTDGPFMLSVLGAGTSGLATLTTPDPEVTLTDWGLTQSGFMESLDRVRPIIALMDRDMGGRPRVAKIYEASSADGSVRLREIRQS